MVPKAIYELLPAVYVVGSIVALAVADHFIVWLPVALLLGTAVYIIHLRYQFRHLSPRQRALAMAQKYRERPSGRQRSAKA